jgi:hypothetical protein
MNFSSYAPYAGQATEAANSGSWPLAVVLVIALLVVWRL